MAKKKIDRAYERERDIRNLEVMFGAGCCDCLDGGRPRLSPHPLQTLRHSQSSGEGKPTGYAEMDLETGEITCHSYRK